MIFHHIFFSFNSTKNSLTPEQSGIIEKHISSNCGKMEYKFWSLDSAKNFMLVNYPELADIFDKLLEKHIVLCDFFRYVLMYHFGGIYTDLDFLIIRPFETFLDNLNNRKISYYPNTIRNPTIILSEEWLDSYNLTDTLHNGILISLTKYHPFWLKLVHEVYQDIMVKRKSIVSENDVYTTSGPKKLLEFYKQNSKYFKDICILPYYYFCPFVSHEMENDTVVKKIYNNAIIPDNLSITSNKSWSFLNIDEHKDLPKLCPNSYFVNVFLNMGSMWK